MERPKPHAAQWKKDEIKEIETLLPKYKAIGVVDMTNMPSPQLQKMRSSLQSTVKIYMTKARLLRIAFDNLKGKIKGIEELRKNIKGMPAIILTNDNPFKLAKTLKKSKSAAPAKAGQLAPNDITIPAGPTPFAPGPVLGELGALGLKAGIQDGKVHIKEDKLAVKEGELITGPMAAMLTRLGIEPMEIGLNLQAVLEEGTIYPKSVLEVDEKAYLNNVKRAAQEAFNLAFHIAFPTKENIKLLLMKAMRDADALAEARDILTSLTVKRKITKSEREAQSLTGKMPSYEPKRTEHTSEQGGP